MASVYDFLRKLLCFGGLPEEDNRIHQRRRQTPVHESQIYPTVYATSLSNRSGSMSGVTLLSDGFYGSRSSSNYSARTRFSEPRPVVHDLSDIYGTWSVRSSHSVSYVPNLCIMQ